MKHKMAAYHSMAHFMFSLPLSDEKIKVETARILEIGEVNGFKNSAISCIIDKHRKKKQLTEISTFNFDPSDAPPVRVGIRYHPEITKLLKPIYRNVNMELVHRNEGSLRNAIGTTKDIPLDLHKSGTSGTVFPLWSLLLWHDSS